MYLSRSSVIGVTLKQHEKSIENHTHIRSGSSPMRIGLHLILYQMTYEQFETLRQWAERVANTANDTDTNIRSIDLVHDIAGILANDEHFLPRL